MEKTIWITVKDKIAQHSNDVIYTCGNSDYNIAFDFDEEWAEYETKTALFVYNGQKTPVVFTGNTCSVPVISNTYQIKVGVFAGNLHTTTPAIVYAQKSILCEGGTPADPPDDVYNQIMQRLNEIGTPDPEAIAAAVAEYIAANPIEEKDPTVPEWAKGEKKPTYTAEEVGAIAETELQNAINTALAQAKESGEFDGTDGKSAYAYAVEGGYTGTEAEFAAKLAAEMPEALPNPYPLELIDTDTGETLASYDGSAPLSVEIPSGGEASASSEWVKFLGMTTEEDITTLLITEDDNGNTFDFDEIKVFCNFVGSSQNTSESYVEFKPGIGGGFLGSFAQIAYAKRKTGSVSSTIFVDTGILPQGNTVVRIQISSGSGTIAGNNGLATGEKKITGLRFWASNNEYISAGTEISAYGRNRS